MTNITVAPTMYTQLNKLVGKSVSGLNLAASMLTIQFGKKITRLNKKGKKSEVGEFAMHIQCAWRISEKNKIVVGIDDYFGIDEENNFKVVTAVLNDTVELDSKVLSVEIIEPSGFTLKLSNNITISAFPAAGIIGNETEAWRVFSPNKETEHFVVMSDGSRE